MPKQTRLQGTLCYEELLEEEARRRCCCCQLLLAAPHARWFVYAVLVVSACQCMPVHSEQTPACCPAFACLLPGLPAVGQPGEVQVGGAGRVPGVRAVLHQRHHGRAQGRCRLCQQDVEWMPDLPEHLHRIAARHPPSQPRSPNPSTAPALLLCDLVPRPLGCPSAGRAVQPPQQLPACNDHCHARHAGPAGRQQRAHGGAHVPRQQLGPGVCSAYGRRKPRAARCAPGPILSVHLVAAYLAVIASIGSSGGGGRSLAGAAGGPVPPPCHEAAPGPACLP